MNERGPILFADEFRAVYEAWWDDIYRYVYGMTSDADVASDVGQEVFVRLFSRGSMPNDLGSWLVSVANNLLRDAGKRRARRAGLLKLHSDAIPRAADAPSPEGETIRKEEELRVHRALGRLPERQRAILLLRAGGRSYAETAAALGIPANSVGTTLARAMAAFRRAYEEAAHAPD